MYKNIPFYGKEGSIRTVRQINDSLFEIDTYKDKDNIITKKVNSTKELVTKDYLKTLNAYLELRQPAYDEAKYRVTENIVIRRCKKILALTLLDLVAIPALGYWLKCSPLIVVGLVTAAVAVPITIYTLNEIINKHDTENIKKSVLEYEDLHREKLRIKEAMETLKPTKFSAIEPKHVENTNSISNTKKLVRTDKTDV